MAKQSKKTRNAADVQTDRRTVKHPETARRGADGENTSGVENLDKVRDILFGSQMRDNERRFGRLEERLIKETADLRDETRKRLDSLESFIRKEIQSVVERLKVEQVQRGDAVKELAAELKEAIKSFSARATELAEQMAETTRQLRQEMLDQSKALRDELQAGRADAMAQIDAAAGELRAQKLDKAALADLLSQMAARLSEQG